MNKYDFPKILKLTRLAPLLQIKFINPVQIFYVSESLINIKTTFNKINYTLIS